MRRKDREINDFDEIRAILDKGLICRIALTFNDVPYIVPMNYGVEHIDPMILYFHCATEGRKIEMLKKNNRVCFEIETDVRVVEGKEACEWSTEYKSVIGYGTIEMISSEEEMLHGLDILMKQYSRNREFTYKQNQLPRMLILKLTVENFSGKSHFVS